MADLVQYYGTGRRKSSVARVFMRPGSGKFTVNDKPFEEYFVTEAQRVAAKQSLVSADAVATFDVLVTASGGGINGQAGAVRLGVARALLECNAELRHQTHAQGFLVRD